VQTARALIAAVALAEEREGKGDEAKGDRGGQGLGRLGGGAGEGRGRMGVMREERAEAGRSFKRLSKRLSKGVKAVAEGAAKRASNRRVPSEVSELSRTRGTALKESNALNDEGVRVVANIAKELDTRLNREKGTNKDDIFSKDKVPNVSIEDYFGRLARYINVWRGHAGGSESAGIRSAVMVMIYLERMEQTSPDYVINWQNIHRLACAGFLVATKFMEDAPISNEYWAKVAGITMTEVNKLEGQFCNLCKFELFVDEEEYHKFLDQFDLPEF
ncbi:Cyclin-U2-2 (CycU2, partial [Durusdinium trenchii]